MDKLDRRLTIGRVAKASGVPASAIRYYERIGVVPAADRAASGYRLYDPSGVERLRFIGRARALGLALGPLAPLTRMLNGGPSRNLRPRLRELVAEQLEAVGTRIAELHRLRRQLAQVVQRMRTAAPRRGAGACRCLETAGARSRRTPVRARRSRTVRASP